MEDNCWADQNSYRVVASVKKKKNFILEHAMKAQRRSKGIALLFN